MIRRILDLLHRLDHVETAAALLAQRFRAEQAEDARIGRIPGLPRRNLNPPFRQPRPRKTFFHARALDLSG